MEKNMKFNILDSISAIYDLSEDCKLEPAFFDVADKDLKTLADYFNATKTQALLIAMIFSINFKRNTVDLDDLNNHFSCNPLKLLRFMNEFKAICDKGLVIRRSSRDPLSFRRANEYFLINNKITEAILQNKPIPPVDQEKFENIYELLEEIYRIGLQRDQDEISTAELFYQTKQLTAGNKHLELINIVDGFGFDVYDNYLLLYLIWKTVSGKETADLSAAFEGIYDAPARRVSRLQDFLAGNNALLKNDLIEIVQNNFLNDSEIKLSTRSLDLLEQCGIKLYFKNKNRDNIINPADIQPKNLHFDDDEMNQLVMLRKLLIEQNLADVQKRLADKQLPTGVTVMLYGSPGTGKTETVLQAAKSSGRHIMKVDISNQKSMWFGESEKMVKRIFTDYMEFSKECELTPILLFNEADGILSKRREAMDSNVAKTENTIQNILLEQLETFDGILIATTNLIGNLDNAFERRFLFKIEYAKPGHTIKAKIWNSKLPILSRESCEKLASAYDFSGGQIENIARKAEIQEIIDGTPPDFNAIAAFCKAELIERSRERIGFRK
jgi:hypothetical protein